MAKSRDLGALRTAVVVTAAEPSCDFEANPKDSSVLKISTSGRATTTTTTLKTLSALIKEIHAFLLN